MEVLVASVKLLEVLPATLHWNQRSVLSSCGRSAAHFFVDFFKGLRVLLHRRRREPGNVLAQGFKNSRRVQDVLNPARQVLSTPGRKDQTGFPSPTGKCARIRHENWQPELKRLV